MIEQCRAFQPLYAVMADPKSAKELEERVKLENLSTQVLSGVEGLEKVASLPETDLVMAAIVGIAGLKPTWAAVTSGKTVLLANKETLVVAGRLFMEAV